MKDTSNRIKNYLPENFEPTNASKADHVCPNCEMNKMSVFHKVKDVPVHSVLNMATREKALNYPKGDILLGFSCNCGFVSNVAFDARMLEYSMPIRLTHKYLRKTGVTY